MFFQNVFQKFLLNSFDKTDEITYNIINGEKYMIKRMCHMKNSGAFVIYFSNVSCTASSAS